MKRFVIVGLGNFGSSVAEALYSEGHDVIALDTDEAAVDRIAAHCSRAAVGDGRQTETLERIGAGEADVAVVSTGDDVTASLLAALALMDLGVEEIYLKVISRDHARIASRIGVTEVVFPERESAFNLANRISDRGVLDYVHLAGDLSIQEMVVRDAWVGKTLRELELRTRFDVSAIAVHHRATGEVVAPPDPSAPLESTDAVLLAGTDDALDALTEE